jgi:hypothetical protein
LTAAASADVPLGGVVSDTADLSYGAGPTGTMSYDLYGPGDTTCSGTPVYSDTASVASGNGTYPSGTYAPTVPGTYRWTTRYSGDANNTPSSVPCNAPGQSVAVQPPSATLVAPCGPVTVTTSAGGITNATASPVPASPAPPALVDLPCGLIGFQVIGLTPHQSVTITLQAPVAATSYWKLQHDAWTELPGATFSGNTVTFTLTDDGSGDSDAVLGQITDPGGPAIPAPAAPIGGTPRFTG